MPLWNYLGPLLWLDCLHHWVSLRDRLQHTSLTCSRALFTLHEYVVDHSGESHELESLRNSSQAAISATVRMVVDIARSFNANAPGLDVEILPPRCSHLVRAAGHLLATSDDMPYKERLADVDEIKKMLQYLNQRWRMAGKYCD